MIRGGTFLVVLSCLFVLAQVARVAMGGVSVIPSDAKFVKSLDGTWRFKLEQGGEDPPRPGVSGRRPIKAPDKLEPFEKVDYREDGSWHDFTVPGNWEMAGYSPANYAAPDNAIGLFRLEFDVPAEWKGRVVKLNFDGVQNGAEVYCNGQPVKLDESSEGKENFHQGGYNPFQADLTPVVKFGQKNLLAVRVYKNTKEVELDTGDYFFMGGIHRPVTLFSVPTNGLDDFYVRTKVQPGGEQAELRVLLHVANVQKGQKATMMLEGHAEMQLAEADDSGKIEFVRQLEHPNLWSAEKPNLYGLDVDLKNAHGETIEHVHKRIGVREVSIENGVMMVNHVPVKFTGICRHDLWPTVGSALGPEQWKQEIKMMKAANINSIRTSHYPYGSGFYDLCDEMGMYVADELAACWTPTDTDELTAAFAQHAREYVQRDKNHPCVVIWAIGNENKVGKNDGVAAKEIRKIDDTRPRLVSIHDSNKMEDNVELDDAHYTTPAEIDKANKMDRRKTIPKTYLENPNVWEVRNGADWGSLDLWAAVMDRTWDVVWKADHVPGSWLWEWQDRAVADKCPVKLWDFDPKTGINLVKVKGLVGAYRDPRPDLYAVKVVYAPIKVDLKPSVREGSIVVKAMNHFSFTDLSELKTTWTLLQNGKEIKSDKLHPKLAPRTSGEISINAPAEAIEQADVVRLNFDYPDGTNMVTYDLRLKPEVVGAPAMNVESVGEVKFPRLNFVLTRNERKNEMWHQAVRHTGKLSNIAVEQADGSSKKLRDDADLYAMPLSGVRKIHADLVMADEKNPEVVGQVDATLDKGAFSYSVTWTRPGEEDKPAKGKKKRNSGSTSDVEQIGWIFQMPASVDHFSWHRKGYWSYYPADHIGRIAGTATPDSAEQDVTHITRVDAFDFNSTKYNCDWTMLADASGRGIGVKCSEDDRQQCRAGTSKDGERELVVNKWCCPPRDISSNIVPDFYLTLKPGQTVKGSFSVGATTGLSR